jgi:hypothetical protein
MAKIKDPILFSKYFNVAPELITQEGLIDPFLNVDTQLFIDPVLLDKSSNQVICKEAYSSFRKHFDSYVRLLAISKREGDAAWKAAQRLLDLSEPPQNGLGYGGSGRSGSSRPNSIRDAIMHTTKDIIELGADDPEMISLMGFFEEDVGADTISDFTTRVIINELAAITTQFCANHGIPIDSSPEGDDPELELPSYKDSSGNRQTIVLVPKDIVRSLPIANDWSDIESAALQNERIRVRVNSFLASVTKPVVADRKAALRYAALESCENFNGFLSSVKDNTNSYDPNLDALSYYLLKNIFSYDCSEFKNSRKFDITNNPRELYEFVLETINYFMHHVENGNLWEELWVKDKPKVERSAQLIYFALSDCFCKANDIDISPEANMGGGPVDFKFSTGYEARVLVELKRSSGSIVHGYEKQLEIYKNASKTNYGIFVIMDYGDRDITKKLSEIRRIKQERIDSDESASEIIVIDASKKASASKRK